jgi:general secretion pathway protein K
MSARGPGRGERGFALLIVLWTLSLFALVGTQLTLSARTEARLAGNLRADAVTEAAADGAVYESVFHLLDGGRMAWPLSGEHRVVLPGAVVDVTLENQAGRVNPNLADPALLQGLLTAVGLDKTHAVSLAAAIIDWRSPNAKPTPNGAKAPQYKAAGRAWGPPGSPIRDIEEMGQILGMTPELLAALAPHLSLYWDGDPDPAVADPVVLDAVQRASGGGQSQMPGLPMQADTGLNAGPGGAPPPAAAAGDEQVVAITAAAIGPGGSRFTRHAIVQITLQPSGKRWHLVAWDMPSA